VDRELEDFLRATFALLTEEQRERFWDDPRVAGTVQDILEYQELAQEIYETTEEDGK
jgi:hypothetical protein